MKKILKRLLLYVVPIALLIALSYGYYRYRYPYGYAHVCDAQISMALKMYAMDHGGAFPSGASSPEASMSQLASNYCNAAVLLAGKAADVEKAERILNSGGLLDSDSCNWHYVEGLTKRDDSRLAIFWDKIPGLGHNSQRITDGKRGVTYVDGASEYIPADKWDAFLAEQARLMSLRSQTNQSMENANNPQERTSQ